MWEELKSPIVPLLIFGAYDLYPVGSWVNRTGIVTVRYLPPLFAQEGLSRDDMLIKVRYGIPIRPLKIYGNTHCGFYLVEEANAVFSCRLPHYRWQRYLALLLGIWNGGECDQHSS